MRRESFTVAGRTIVAAAAALVVFGGTASALVLTEKTEEQKLRADIFKQQSKYVDCLVKADLACEKTSTTVGKDCTLATGTAINGGDEKVKFVAAIAKCDSKLAFMKKAKTLTAGTAYTAIGCPGDSDGISGNGDQPWADMTAYQGGLPASSKTQIDTLAIVVGAVAGDAAICGPIVPPATDDQLKCGNAFTKEIGGYSQGLYKCLLACENDYKDKKGNGGGTDSLTNCAIDSLTPVDGTNTSGNVNFNACVDKVYAKLLKKVPGISTAALGSVMLGQINLALQDASDDVHNQNDCP